MEPKRILSFSAISFSWHSSTVKIASSFFSSKDKQNNSRVPPPKPNWFCLLLLQKPIYFSICNGQLKCNGGKKEKIPNKRGKKNKCVSGSVYTQRWVSFIFVERRFPGSNVLSSGKSTIGTATMDVSQPTQRHRPNSQHYIDFRPFSGDGSK